VVVLLCRDRCHRLHRREQMTVPQFVGAVECLSEEVRTYSSYRIRDRTVEHLPHLRSHASLRRQNGQNVRSESSEKQLLPVLTRDYRTEVEPIECRTTSQDRPAHERLIYDVGPHIR